MTAKQKSAQTYEQLADDLARNSIVAKALSRLLEQVIREVYETATAQEREACAKLADNKSEFADCEGLGTMDPETGVRECRGNYCPCEFKIEHGEEIAALIRARK